MISPEYELLKMMGARDPESSMSMEDEQLSFEMAMYMYFYEGKEGYNPQQFEVVGEGDDPTWGTLPPELSSGVDVENPVYAIEVNVSAPDIPDPEPVVDDAPWYQPIIETAAEILPAVIPAIVAPVATAVETVADMVIEMTVEAPDILEPVTESEAEVWPWILEGIEGILGMTGAEIGSTAAKGAIGGGVGVVTGGVLSELGELFGLSEETGVQTAPKAGLITGDCPPGMTRRRVAWGRDICVKPRRINYLNPKALRRATRRMAGFHGFAMSMEKEIQKTFRNAGVRSPRRISGGRCGTCRKTSCSCGR